jgi:hypothetical protein
MKINVLAGLILDDRLGRLRKGQIVELPDHKAMFYIREGMAEAYETKVMRDYPSQAAGKPLSALQVGQVLTKQTLSTSETGEKKTRKRKKALS